MTTRDPRLSSVFGPSLGRGDRAALRKIRDDDEFIAAVAWLRGIHDDNRRRATVAPSEVSAWLAAVRADLGRAAELALLLMELPAKSPPGVRAWLMERAAVRGWQRRYLEIDRDAAGVFEVVTRWQTLFAETSELAQAARPGKGRPRTAAAREPIAEGIKRIGRRYRLKADELAAVRRIVFFDMADATVAPPPRIAKLKRPPSKMPRAK